LRIHCFSLPGLDEKDVELLLRDSELIIRGERQSEKEDQERRMSERYYGRFKRRIALPAEVEEDKVGVLRRRCTDPRSVVAAPRSAVTLTRSASR